MFLIIFLIFLATLIYTKLIKPLKFWDEKGVASIKPWPLLGNMAPQIFKKRAFVELVNDFYKSHPEKRYVGIYQFRDPVLMIRDPDLLKQILVKDFDAFADRRPFGTKDSDPVWSKTLLQLTVEDGWQDLRATLSPAFTSSKMKAMFSLMQECAEQLINHLPQQEEAVGVELHDIFAKFTIDVIATTAFGVTCNSLDNPENEFYLKGKGTTGTSIFRFIGHSISPALMKLLKITVFDKEISDFFRKVITETIQVREENHVVRPDMIYLLMEARKGRLKYDDHCSVGDTGFAIVKESQIGRTQKRPKADLTDDDITAQAILFFAAGYHTSSYTMCYLSYELALNPDIQEKLHKEIDATLKGPNEHITYEALLGMKYLDCVVSETLRKWSPATVANRMSLKPYVIEPKQKGEEPVHLEPGSYIWIPIFSMHRDPKYYDNPEKFDPERFNDQNKHKIKPFTYLPFGGGPRNCIGSRFALLEIKLLAVELYRRYQIVPVDETQVNFEFSKKTSNPVPAEGFWFGLQTRTTTL